ncbi:MAG: ABC transporter substrate-binding protein [Zetaproteobacteria bacterium]|nr:MAG: ABC transporter substrate-binding protein [Zetaproteobacteria bacterium]
MPRHPPSCGPYRMISWNNGVIRLAKTGNAPRTAPEAIVFRVVPDPTTRALKLARGELDLIQGDIPAHLVPFLRRRARIRLVARPSLTFAYIGLNLRKPPLSDRRVRQALAMAIDRKALIEGLFGGLPVPAETILPPEHWAGVELPPYPFDPDAAERLLDEAGYPRRPDGVRFTITYRTSTNAERIWLAQAIQAMWRRIGVRAKIESLEWGAFYARIKRGDFDVFSLAWVGVRDPEIYRWILHSQMTPPRGANRGGFRDPEVDRWLDAARSAPTLSARAALYRRVARRMHEALVYIPLWREPVIAAYRTDRIRRYRPSADGGFWHVLSLEAAPSQASASGQGPGSG